MRRRYGMKAPRERGRPARIKNLAQPWHLPELDYRAKAPWLCFGRADAEGGRLQHRRETERQPKGQDAGGTPALPGGSSRWCGGGYPAGGFSESRRAPFGKHPFARPPRRGRSIEKDHPFNIDAQDAQDNQDGRLLHETLAPAMIACGFTDVQQYKPAVSRKISCASM